MNESILSALYAIEETCVGRGKVDVWTSPSEVADQLQDDHPMKGDTVSVRHALEQLWVARRVLQIPVGSTDPIEHVPFCVPGTGFEELALEKNDCRGDLGEVATAAIYAKDTQVLYGSRTTEIVLTESRCSVTTHGGVSSTPIPRSSDAPFVSMAGSTR